MSIFFPGIFEGVLVALIGLVTWFIWDFLDGRNQPPGPLRIPFLGNLVQVAVSDPVPFVGMHKLCKRYEHHGLTRIQLGFMKTVFVNFPAMKDLFTREECLDRAGGGEMEARNMNKNLGILLSEGPLWIETRRFVLKTLKNFGFSKRAVMESVIFSEVEQTLEEMKVMAKSSGDGTVLIDQGYFAPITLNVVLWMVTGQRCDRADKDSTVNRFVRVGRRYVDSFSVISGLYNFWPFLKTLSPSLSGFKFAQELAKQMQDITREIIHEAKASGTYKHSQNCFVDEFIEKMEEEKGGQDEKLFTEDNFVITVMDLIQAGSDTTSANITFGILLLASFPKVQTKFVEEMVKVVGAEGVPCLEDRDRMPYAQAVIVEILRYTRVLMLLPRLVHKDISYQGYTIKRGTVLMLNAHHVTMDPDVWGDPQVFRPERFMNEEGASLNRASIEKVLPFGIGKRNCVGEGVARDTLFLMLTTFMKRLEFSLPEDRPKPSLVPKLGITATCVPFHVRINPRSS